MRSAILSALFLIGTLRVVHEPPVLVRFESNVPEAEARHLAGAFKQALDEAGSKYESRPFELVEIVFMERQPPSETMPAPPGGTRLKGGMAHCTYNRFRPSSSEASFIASFGTKQRIWL